MSVRTRSTVLVEGITFVAMLAFAVGTNPLRAASFDVFEGHDEYVYMIALSNDGRLMATASGDNTAILWDTRQRIALHVLRHDAAVYAVAMSPDGKSIATASGDGYVTLWNARDGSHIARVKKHNDAVYCVAFSPDGQRLASAGGSTNGGDTVCRIWRTSDLQLVTELAGHVRQVYGVAFSPDGQTVATSSSDKTIRLWNVVSGRNMMLQGHSSDVYRCAFSPDGKLLASASLDGTVRVWTVQTGDVALLFDGTKKNPVYAVAFSCDGCRLAAVGDDRRLRIWRTNDWRLTWEKKVSPCALYAVTFLPDQASAAVAGEDGTVYTVVRIANPETCRGSPRPGSTPGVVPR
jgi:WD40 repeat protein